MSRAQPWRYISKTFIISIMNQDSTLTATTTGAHRKATGTVIARENPLLHEVTSVLREWGHMWKQLYVVSGSSAGRQRVGTPVTCCGNGWRRCEVLLDHTGVLGM